MTRFAEASARAGRAVPDNSAVDWTKEREAAQSLLNGSAPEQAPPSRPTAASPRPINPIEPTASARPINSIEPTASARPVDSVEEIFQWPAKFDLDAVDLSADAHARNFRRRSSRTQAPQVEQRADLDDVRTPPDSAWRHGSVASSVPAGVSAIAISPREPAVASRRGTHREVARAETRRVTPRWVLVAMGITILVALALLTYWLRRPQVAAGSPDVRPVASAWLAPIAVDVTRTASCPS
jgi:hypothetical protein